MCLGLFFSDDIKLEKEVTAPFSVKLDYSIAFIYFACLVILRTEIHLLQKFRKGAEMHHPICKTTLDMCVCLLVLEAVKV